MGNHKNSGGTDKVQDLLQHVFFLTVLIFYCSRPSISLHRWHHHQAERGSEAPEVTFLLLVWLICDVQTFDAQHDEPNGFFRSNSQATRERNTPASQTWFSGRAYLAWSSEHTCPSAWNKVNVWGLNSPDRAMKQRGGAVTYTYRSFVFGCGLFSEWDTFMVVIIPSMHLCQCVLNPAAQ